MIQSFRVIPLVLLAACMPESAVLPVAAEGSLTARATEVCSRRMAQLAARHKFKSLTSVVKGAEPNVGGGMTMILLVTIDYGPEVVQAPVRCSVSVGGRVEDVTGLDVLPTPGRQGENQ